KRQVIHPILGNSYPHQGIDFLVGEGSPIWATAEGVISRVELQNGGDAAKIYIQHTPTLSTAYYPVNPRVQVGQWVTIGTLIGTVTRIPLARAPFLHYEVWVHHETVDPLPFLWGHFSFAERQRWKQAFSRQTHALH
ncbi:MAG: M23 family metallopeptidase, partial [Bacteroidia bacterium]|nr:M23 family metallopeptidase [Bacteroidia bacterium]